MSDRDEPYTIKAEAVMRGGAAGETPCFLSVEQGRVAALSPKAPPERGRKVLDCSGLVLCPPFCDYHLHFTKKRELGDIADQLIRAGIGRVYEAGDRDLCGMDARGRLRFPEVITSGYALFNGKGYGRALGKSVAGGQEARAVIDQLASLQADYCKVVNSGLYDPETNTITEGGFEEAELRQIVEYAGTKGLRVFCHANGRQAVKESVAAGVSVIVHGLDADEETLDRMAEKSTALIPTLAAFEALSVIAGTDRARGNIRSRVESHSATVKRAFERGVPILPGSDSGPSFIPYGTAFIRELGLLLRAGLPFSQLMRAAAPGEIRVGGAADFLLLDRQAVRHVLHGGKFLEGTERFFEMA